MGGKVAMGERSNGGSIAMCCVKLVDLFNIKSWDKLNDLDY